MCLSCTISEILNIKQWRSLEFWVRGHSRSLTVTPVDRSYTTTVPVRLLLNYSSILYHLQVI